MPLTPTNTETSQEILDAISWLADSEEDQVRVWQEPTKAEALAIWERVTKNGLIPAESFTWGAAGRNWMAELDI